MRARPRVGSWRSRTASSPSASRAAGTCWWSSPPAPRRSTSPRCRRPRSSSRAASCSSASRTGAPWATATLTPSSRTRSRCGS
eukprot:5801468-Alexandrium_andersonii.AAC.1